MTPINAPEGLIKMIRQDEGFRNRTYIDSEGFETLGIGLCLEKSPTARTRSTVLVRVHPGQNLRPPFHKSIHWPNVHKIR